MDLSFCDDERDIKHYVLKRAIVPEDTIGLEISTIDCGDASMQISCAAIYARFQRRNSKFSCQLVFSCSKILPESLTQPRCELSAANLCAHTGEVVKRAFGKYHTSANKLTDSQIVIHWLNNKNLHLKQWVRNRVIDILRLTDSNNWYYVKSADMIADLGTRRGATVKDVNQESAWNLGFSWMS